MLKDLKTRTEMSEVDAQSMAPEPHVDPKQDHSATTIDVLEKTVKAAKQVQVLRQSHAARPQRCQTRRLPHLKGCTPARTNKATKEETKVTPAEARRPRAGTESLPSETVAHTDRRHPIPLN